MGLQGQVLSWTTLASLGGVTAPSPLTDEELWGWKISRPLRPHSWPVGAEGNLSSDPCLVTVKGGGVTSSAVLIAPTDNPAVLALFVYLAPKNAFPGHPASFYLKWDGSDFSL